MFSICKCAGSVTMVQSDESHRLVDYLESFESYRDREERNSFIWLYMIGSLLLVLVFTVWIAFRSFYGEDQSPLTLNVRSDFEKPLSQAMGVALFGAITISIFERPSSTEGTSSESIYDVDDYNERLVVVRPNNWLIYTFNGITFHYIVNNVNRSRTKCTSVNGLTAVEYRLQTRTESRRDSYANNVRLSCVHYTFDQLIRLFNTTANRTDIDVTNYFDRNKYPRAPKFSVFSVLQLLVRNRLL